MTTTVMIILGIFIAIAGAAIGFLLGRTTASGDKDSYATEKEMRIRAETQVEAQKAMMEDWEKQKQDLIQASKTAALSSLAEMSTKLLNDHKTEAENVQKLGEQNIKKTSDNLQEHFNKLIGKVSEFEGRLGQQESGLDILNRMLTEPQKMGEAAEVILENNLKILGLTEPKDFLMQPSFKTTAGRLRPDAVIFLPDDNVIIVDSKSSAIFKELVLAESDDAIDEVALSKKLKSSMRKHLQDLSGKDYISAVKKGIKTQHRDFQPNEIVTLLWVPSDGMLERIHKADEEFILAASGKGIIVVGPSALHASIAVAAMKISAQKQNENQAVIVSETTQLLQYITSALQHAGKIGRAIHTADKAFEDLAGSVNNRLLPKARRLVELGVSKPQGDFGKPLPSRVEDAPVIEEISDSTEPQDHPDE